MTTKNGTTKKQLGVRGEEIATTYLKREGYKVLDRDWRCSAGTADIIAREADDELAFIEVRVRKQADDTPVNAQGKPVAGNGLPDEGITAERRNRQEGIAIQYLASHDQPSCRVRFDVISLLLITDNKCFLRHHKDVCCTIGEDEKEALAA
jgi:putative endonuclease